MNWSIVLNIVIAIAIAVLTVFICIVAFQLSRTLGSLNHLIKDIDEEVTPMIAKLQVTVDEVNSELERVDEIVESAQNLSRKVDTTTKVAQEIIASPLIKLAALSAGIKKAVGSLTKNE